MRGDRYGRRSVLGAIQQGSEQPAPCLFLSLISAMQPTRIGNVVAAQRRWNAASDIGALRLVLLGNDGAATVEQFHKLAPGEGNHDLHGHHAAGKDLADLLTERVQALLL